MVLHQQLVLLLCFCGLFFILGCLLDRCIQRCVQFSDLGVECLDLAAIPTVTAPAADRVIVAAITTTGLWSCAVAAFPRCSAACGATALSFLAFWFGLNVLTPSIERTSAYKVNRYRNTTFAFRSTLQTTEFYCERRAFTHWPCCDGLRGARLKLSYKSIHENGFTGHVTNSELPCRFLLHQQLIDVVHFLRQPCNLRRQVQLLPV